MSLYIGETQIGRVIVGAPSVGSDVFVVTVSWDETEGKWVPDCTYGEVAAAYAAGKEITVQADGDSSEVSADGQIINNNLVYWVRVYAENDTYPGMIETAFIFSSSGLALSEEYTYIETPSESITITSNDTYDVTNYAEAVVNVPTGTARTESDITVSGATVNVPAGLYYSAASKSVASGSVTAPSTISGTGSNVSASNNTLTLTKTVSVTPNVTTPGYISSGTAGDSSVSLSASVNTRSSSDLTASGATVTAPAGYYGSNATKTIASGSATPASSISATGATLSTGTNTLTLSKSVSNTPQVSAGYISSGTAGDSSVSLTANVTTKAATTITPTGSQQTIASGTYLTGAQTIQGVVASNLTAENIKKGVTVKVGTSTDDDSVTSVTGTYEGSGGGGGLKLATATATLASASSSISFTGLLGEPTSFSVVSAANLATGASPYKTAAVVFDGTNVIGQYITNTNNAQMTYSSSAFSKSYSNGTLTISGTDSNFQANQYKLTYTYDGSSANIATEQVQVGSGVTSITFTGLSDEPTYWSCLFTSNIGTSSGYTRAHVVVFDGSDTYGMEMGSGSNATSNWSATYNNGSLTISSQSTSAGGYFHQPGYYQLTYAVGGEIEITTEPLSVTSNGTYTAPRGKAYTPVTVNVSSSGGWSTDTKTVSGGSTYPVSLSFSSMNGEPKAFFLRTTAQISSSGSTTYYYITAMRYDGTDTTGNCFRIGSTRRVDNITSGYSWSYSGTTLTISSSASSRSASPGAFYSGDYELVYFY